jgi:hypothetical protein
MRKTENRVARDDFRSMTSRAVLLPITAAVSVLPDLQSTVGETRIRSRPRERNDTADFITTRFELIGMTHAF